MSIPFYYPNKHEAGSGSPSKKEVRGILSFIDRELLFEYKVYDADGNALSNLSKFSIQLDHIKHLNFHKGFLFLDSTLEIEANMWAFFEPLPGSHEGKIRLRIRRPDRNEAQRFTKKMNFYRSGATTDRRE